MKLADLFQQSSFCLSFELFPPKTSAGEEALMRHVRRLMEFSPSFVTCTYGAGGSTRDRTLEIVLRVKRTFNVSVASHLTCVGATADELRDYLKRAFDGQVDNIVALRGDPPQGETEFRHVGGGLRYASELVALIREEFPQFGIAVAGYPETHQEAPDAETDLKNLKHKVSSGADVVITQLFYNNADFFKFRQRYDQAGINVPLVPGLLPVTNLAQIKRITGLCGAKLPKGFVDRLSMHDDAQWQFSVGIEQATEQVRGLVEAGVPGLHFYVLNRSEAAKKVLQSVQLPSR